MKIGKKILISTCGLGFIGVSMLFRGIDQKESFTKEKEEVTIAYYVDEKETNEMPKKGSGYTLSSKSSCTNGITISFDEKEWSIKVDYKGYLRNDEKRTKCTLYFEKASTADQIVACGKNGTVAGECLSDTVASDEKQGLVDESEAKNVRYVGVEPSNYVQFNNELWRIIGVMKDVENGSGTKETRIKIIREESIGNFRWDSYGNIWEESTVQKILNPGYESDSEGQSLYWNRKKGICYGEKECDFTQTGLTENAKAMIEEAVWHLGTNGSSNDYYKIKAEDFYALERGESNLQKCDEDGNCTSASSTWKGYVGLMYPSDYGYATNVENFDTRARCLNAIIYSWDAECYENNWLFQTGTPQWTITSRYYSSSQDYVFSCRTSWECDFRKQFL